MKKWFSVLLTSMMLLMLLSAVSLADEGGTWGGIDWTLTDDGTLTISPTKGTPGKNNSGTKTYKVGQWPDATFYDESGSPSSVSTGPYHVYSSRVKKLVIEEGVTSIGSWTARNFTNLTGEVVIPSTVTYIGHEAFQNSTFETITFALGGTETLCIAQGAFKNLAIKEIELPHDRPEIHLHAWLFLNSKQLEHITFPANIKLMGTNHLDYFNYSSKDHNGGNDNTSTIIDGTNTNLEGITFGSEEVKQLFFNRGYADLLNGLKNVKVLEKVVTPLADPVAQNSISYGTKLSGVKLSDGWTWVNPDFVPAVGEESYLACFVPEDMANYDYSSLPGWNKDTKRIERMAAVTVLPAPASPPQTGDDSNLFLFAALAAVSALGTVVLKKREQF